MSAHVTPVDPAILALLEDAAWWRLLGRLFECPSPEWRADIAALASEVKDADLKAAVAAALVEATEGHYHSVFGPGGPAPPREVSYQDLVELGSVMSSLTGAYAAFGYAPASAESPDHVAVEAGFVGFLRLKEAFARIDGQPARAVITAEAAEAFRRGHLAVYAERLAALLEESPFDYLRVASRLLAARVGPKPGPRQLPVIQPNLDDEGSAFSCDSSPAA